MNNVVLNKAEIVKQFILQSGYEEPDVLIGHDFMGGCYIRTMTAPAGSLLVGKIHKHKTLNILLSGSVSAIENDSDSRIIQAPSVWESEAGVRKAFYVHSDIICLNIHPTSSTNLEEIEKEFTEEEV